jgi:hypothetical protein
MGEAEERFDYSRHGSIAFVGSTASILVVGLSHMR